MGNKILKKKYWAVLLSAWVFRLFGVINFGSATVVAISIIINDAGGYKEIMGISPVYFCASMIMVSILVCILSFGLAQLIESIISIEGKTKAEGQYLILERIALELEEQNNILRELNGNQSNKIPLD